MRPCRRRPPQLSARIPRRALHGNDSKDCDWRTCADVCKFQSLVLPPVQTSAHLVMQMFEAMNRAIKANGIKPVIDKVFGFDEVQAAYKHMASGAHFGKIVIRVVV